MKNLIEKLYFQSNLTDDELIILLTQRKSDDSEYLYELARKRQAEHYGNKVFIRGLVETSSYCKNDCFYCGLRRSNKCAQRYRLSKEQILSCCDEGHPLGFRTFVLQGGEDTFYTDNVLCDIISSIKNKYSDCAVTLSLGERSFESYKKLFEAGADRYLLRHETASPEHYSKLHPGEMSYNNRMECIKNLKSIGFQTGCGFMVGTPFQTMENIVRDLRFIKTFAPHMVGIGPFIAHHDTPFKDERQGSSELTLFLIAVIRLLLPAILLPATTALGTASKDGREKGVLAGANVLMPNLSPKDVRDKYLLYDNKLNSGEEAAENIRRLKQSIKDIGYEIVTDRGDSKAE
ncbi:MAG: [FeFe] hydrogenase H-cluster radical SAM maturase HydE [Clostridiaceae bacterium]|nr:[FeFe] hydrogenase H-cluster radical SAM maturase HydE [Clostridiaceae bacterium]